MVPDGSAGRFTALLNRFPASALPRLHGSGPRSGRLALNITMKALEAMAGSASRPPLRSTESWGGGRSALVGHTGQGATLHIGLPRARSFPVTTKTIKQGQAPEGSCPFPVIDNPESVLLPSGAGFRLLRFRKWRVTAPFRHEPRSGVVQFEEADRSVQLLSLGG